MAKNNTKKEELGELNNILQETIREEDLKNIELKEDKTVTEVKKKKNKKSTKTNKTKRTVSFRNDNVLSKEITRKIDLLSSIEKFIQRTDKEPEIIFDLFDLFPEIETEFRNEIKGEIQDFLYSNVYIIEEFRSNKIIMEYDKEYFPSNIKVLYTNNSSPNIPILLINLKNKEYKYLVSEERLKFEKDIQICNKNIKDSKEIYDNIINVRNYIGENYDINTHKFKNTSEAKEKIYNYLNKDKKFNMFSKISFNFNFKDNQEKYVDEVCGIYDLASNTLADSQKRKIAYEERLSYIEKQLETIDGISNSMISLLLKHDYKTR